MHNKITLFSILFISLAALAIGQPRETALSKEEIIKLIPKSDNLLDLQERDNLLKLIAAVDSVYPVLCEELLSTDEANTPGTIIAILSKSKKNKESVLKCIREYMIRHKDDDPQPDSMFTGIKSLGEIGGAEDAELLSHFLNIGFESSRVVASQSIEQIRIREQTREREAAPTKRDRYREEGLNTPKQDLKSDKVTSANISNNEGYLAHRTYIVLSIFGLIASVGGLLFLLKSFGQK